MRVFKIILVIIAAIIALTYALDYDYLFRGIAKTYLRGETSATIDDAALFPSHKINVGQQPKIWQKDSLYNKQKLPQALQEDLKNSNTVSFLLVKNGKLLHEQ